MTTSIFHTRRRPAGIAGFTLIELLLVISVISILLGMLISTVRAVRRYSRQTITRGELKNIEAAWKQFYAYYQYWPDAESISIRSDEDDIGDKVIRKDYDGDAGYEMLAPLARMLAGMEVKANGDSSEFDTYNVDKIAFMEFSPRSDEESGVPLNAWGKSRRARVNMDKKPNTYMVVFDTNGDNFIELNLPGEKKPYKLYCSVAVWTENPEYTEPKGGQAPKGPPKYFGSWME